VPTSTAIGSRQAARAARRPARGDHSGGAIPDANTYDVVLWPEETKVGSIEEDWAIESSAGDIFQLGNTAWRIRRIEAGRVLVEDARGQPPSIPFWLGEAPARTRELSTRSPTCVPRSMRGSRARSTPT